MGAYNMSYAGMSRAIRKYNTNDYWMLSRLEGGIPWETTLYVPKIFALAIVMNNREAFGLDKLAEDPAVSFDTATTLFLLRRDDHDHLTAFHLRHLFRLAELFEIGLQTFQHTSADFLVSHLTTAETQRDLGLVALFEEAGQITQLDVVIAVISTRTELHFLDLDDFLLQLGFVGFFLLLILELSVVHQAAHWGICIGCNFHQIHVCLFRHAEGFSQTHDANRLVVNPC